MHRSTCVKVSQKTASGNAVSHCITCLQGIRLGSRKLYPLCHLTGHASFCSSHIVGLLFVLYSLNVLCFYYSPSYTHLFLFYDKINVFNK